MNERKLKRRSVLTAGLGAGLALGLGAGVPKLLRRSTAQDAGYAGPYFMFVGASGGWDPMFLFNPTLDTTYNRLYSSMPSVGALTCAGLSLDYERLGWDPAMDYATYLRTPEQLAQAHGARMTVLNGIDTSTNNHDGGQRAMGSGRLSTGYPSLGALIAAARAPQLPMAYLSAGGYDATEGHVALARVENADALARVARPLRMNASDPASELFHTTDTFQRIARTQRERTEALLQAQRLPALRQGIEALTAARANTAVLDQLELPTEPAMVPVDGLGDLQGFMQQAQMAIACFKSGVSAVANVVFGGFDTHGNHDRDQLDRMLKLLGGIDFILAEADRQGIAQDLYVIVTSDFGRGPHYNSENDGAGKDHWPVTSLIAIGPGIAGNRMIGGTDGDQVARTIDPGSLAVADGGVKLTPETVHIALRKVAGIADHELCAAYALAGEDLPLFG